MCQLSAPRIASCPLGSPGWLHGLTSSGEGSGACCCGSSRVRLDRMDRREIQHVETHALHIRQPGLAIGAWPRLKAERG
jgi:hypothetical protein